MKMTTVILVTSAYRIVAAKIISVHNKNFACNLVRRILIVIADAAHIIHVLPIKYVWVRNKLETYAKRIRSVSMEPVIYQIQ